MDGEACEAASRRVSLVRPAFGGDDCGGADVEAELCHQQVSSFRVCLHWASTLEVSNVYSVDDCTHDRPRF